ncbi:MAG: class I SAM-dependent methyltransferase [Gammaproteobacteria bacterium]|nr:class I SAM-dependent methyltransferase [Gammaproteobacteria bacterium]
MSPSPARAVAPPMRASQRAPARVSGRVYGIERRLLKFLLRILGNPPVAFVLWNGDQIAASTGTPLMRVLIHDRAALFDVVRNPDLHFGDLYSQGRIEVEGSLLELMEIINRSVAAACARGGLGARLMSPRQRARPNTLRGSRDNIHQHYDIGNEFYRLWLDERMLYTCAYFSTPTDTLEQAQIAKMDHVCRKLQLKPGEQVAEAGCGWGALALHMARDYGVKVKAYNVSHQQILYARERARAEGLDGRVEFVEDDYRTIDGRFDAFVSVGMLEHVGVENYRGLGDVIRRVLKDTGRGLIHTIGRNRVQPMNAWIEKRIFPGAYPPTLGEMMAIFEPHEFSVLDVENLRLHYARTLEHWLWRFEKSAERIQAMFDENFVRAWRLYLAGSCAAFTTSDLQLFQVLFAPRNNNDLAWTREHLYATGAGGN